MKKTYFLILFNIFSLTGLSQSNIRLNNYWENTYYINPASVYNEYRVVASVAGRKQWISFPGAPDSEFITFAAHIKTHVNKSVSQLGLKAFHDKIGYTDLINISPSYSFLVRLDKDRTRLSFGFAYKFQNITYDMAKATLATADDPAIYRTETRWSAHNADAGIELVTNSLIIGAACQNIMSIFENNEHLQTNSNFLYIMNRYEIDDNFHLLSGICAINNESLYQLEFKTSVLLHSGNNPGFQIGILYRTIKELGVLFGMDLNSSIRLAFSYDYNIGGIRHSSFGSPELMLIWKFGKVRNCDCSELLK
jgi:type IX secretion system PorP/SprF family membrane protein